MCSHIHLGQSKERKSGHMWLGPSQRLEKDHKQGWRSKRERHPAKEVWISHLTAISAVLPYTSLEML